jgi:tRNA-dependent cyclodipeptide synthase
MKAVNAGFRPGWVHYCIMATTSLETLSANDVDFLATPYSDHCARITDQGEHAVVGISLFNGYYSPARIEALTRWACRNFRNVDVLTPGTEAAYTLATVMPPRQAAQRVRRAIRSSHNAALRALRQCCMPEPEQHVASWTRLLERPAYVALAERARVAHSQDPAVAAMCEQAVHAVLDGITVPVSPDAVRHATHYVLAELPFLVNSPAIFGVRTSVFVYHRSMPFLDQLFALHSDVLGRSPDQAHLTVTPATQE